MFENSFDTFQQNKNSSDNEEVIELTILPFNGKELEFWGLPTKCPHCNKLAQMNIIGKVNGPKTTIDITLVVFQCIACRELIIGRYIQTGLVFRLFNGNNRSFFYPIAEYQYREFPKEIKEVSPKFPSIYNQAAKGEHYGCIDIAGAGFRKAAEFLVRDFAIYKNENKKEKILNTLAARNVIRNFLSGYSRISRAAMASLELGNDEAHYSKIYPEYSLKDLNDFIEIVVGEIVDELKLEQFEKDIAETKNKDLMPVNKTEKISQKFDVPKDAGEEK